MFNVNVCFIIKSFLTYSFFFHLRLLYQPYLGLCQAPCVQSHQRQLMSAVAITACVSLLTHIYIYVTHICVTRPQCVKKTEYIYIIHQYDAGRCNTTFGRRDASVSKWHHSQNIAAFFFSECSCHKMGKNSPAEQRDFVRSHRPWSCRPTSEGVFEMVNWQRNYQRKRLSNFVVRTLPVDGLAS